MHSHGPQLNDKNQMSMPPAAVQGTSGSFGFNATQSNTFPATSTTASGTRTENLVFSGQLNADQITGTLTENITITPGGAGSGTYAVMLTRQ